MVAQRPFACPERGAPLRADIERPDSLGSVLTIYGICALTFMMVMYGLEQRHPNFVALFALGCLLSSAYGFASGAWPFGVLEAIWAVIAARRFSAQRSA
jgi:hypothetical protein